MYFAVTCHNCISKCSIVNRFNYIFPQPSASSCVDHMHHTIVMHTTLFCLFRFNISCLYAYMHSLHFHGWYTLASIKSHSNRYTNFRTRLKSLIRTSTFIELMSFRIQTLKSRLFLPFSTEYTTRICSI